MAGLPVLACFFGGATEKWSEGIVIALLGLFLLVAPPRFSLGPWANGILLALALCAAVAFLPARWFFEPAWRTALVNDFAVQLPSTLSPQPWLTLGCLISFLAGLSWVYFVTAEDLELRAVRLQLRLFAGGIVFSACSASHFIMQVRLCRFGIISAASVRSQIAIRPATFSA